jgi:hypothetical protein
MARRDAWQAKGRNAVAFAMVMLPVLAVVALDVAGRTADVSPAESLSRTMGAADALAQWSGTVGAVAQSPDAQEQLSACKPCGDSRKADSRTEAAMLAALSAGSRLIPYREGGVSVRTRLGVSRPAAVELDIADPHPRDFRGRRRARTGWPWRGRRDNPADAARISGGVAVDSGQRPGIQCGIHCRRRGAGAQ